VFAKIVGIVADMQQITDGQFTKIIGRVIVVSVNRENGELNLHVMILEVYFILRMANIFCVECLFALALYVLLKQVQTLIYGFLRRVDLIKQISS
jgi:hypothetical protein